MWCLLAASITVHAFAPSNEIIVGNVRVQALSPSLVRIEPKGPRGFEDQTTFSVVNRAFDGIDISLLNSSGQTSWVGTRCARARNIFGIYCLQCLCVRVRGVCM